MSNYSDDRITNITCPTCGAMSNFTCIGVQTWPERVAQALQIPTETALYCCSNCETTLNALSLFPGKTA